MARVLRAVALLVGAGAVAVCGQCSSRQPWCAAGRAGCTDETRDGFPCKATADAVGCDALLNAMDRPECAACSCSPANYDPEFPKADPNPTDPCPADGTCARALSPAQIARVVHTHNEYRTHHSQRALVYDTALGDTLLTKPNVVAACEQGLNAYVPNGGELAFEVTGGDVMLHAWDLKPIVRDWYCESEGCYDYTKNAAADIDPDALSFTQMVWAASQRIGCAACQIADATAGDHRKMLFCAYDPPGNIDMQFLANVAPAVATPANATATATPTNATSTATVTPSTAVTDTPDTSAPTGTDAPQTMAPVTATPGGTVAPETPTPGPDTAMPGTLAPGATVVPPTPVPDTTVPGTLVPGATVVPPTPAPAGATPAPGDTPAPATGVPDATSTPATATGVPATPAPGGGGISLTVVPGTTAAPPTPAPTTPRAPTAEPVDVCFDREAVTVSAVCVDANATDACVMSRDGVRAVRDATARDLGLGIDDVAVPDAECAASGTCGEAAHCALAIGVTAGARERLAACARDVAICGGLRRVGAVAAAAEVEEPEEGSFPWWVIIIIVALLAVLCVVPYLYLSRQKQKARGCVEVSSLLAATDEQEAELLEALSKVAAKVPNATIPPKSPISPHVRSAPSVTFSDAAPPNTPPLPAAITKSSV